MSLGIKAGPHFKMAPSFKQGKGLESKYLYKDGRENTARTGGWEFPTIYSSMNMIDSNYLGGTCTRTKYAANMYLETSYYSIASVHTKNKVDFRGITKIKVKVTQTAVNNSSGKCGLLSLWSVKPQGTLNSTNRLGYVQIPITSDSYIEMDVSTIDEAYIMYSNSSSYGITPTNSSRAVTTITEIVLE